MALSAATIIQRINRKIHNLAPKLGGDSEILDIMNEANRDLQLEMDLASLQRPAPNFLAYSNTYEYALPVDIAYDKSISIKKSSDLRWTFEKGEPFSFQNIKNTVTGLYNWSWGSGNNLNSNSLGNDPWLNSSVNNPKNIYAIDFQNTAPYLLLRGDIGRNEVQLSAADDITSNGTWSVSSDATNLRKDEQRLNLSFDSQGSFSTLVATNSTITALDLTSYVNLGRAFVTVNFPSTVPSSVTLRWGSSSGDYYEKSTSFRQNGLSFIPGVNVLGFDWLGATVVGAPSYSAITFLEIVFTNSAPVALTNYGIRDFEMRLGDQMDMMYYSKYSVASVLGVYKEEFTATDDVTLLQEEEVNLLILKSAMKAAQQIREISADYQIFMNEYMQMKQQYEFKHPSRKQLEMDSYYIV